MECNTIDQVKIIRGTIRKVHQLLNEYAIEIETPDGETHYPSSLLKKYIDCPVEIIIYHSNTGNK